MPRRNLMGGWEESLTVALRMTQHDMDAAQRLALAWHVSKAEAIRGALRIVVAQTEVSTQGAASILVAEDFSMPRGRPRTGRDAVIFVRIDPGDAKYIGEIAAGHGLTSAEYTRRAAMAQALCDYEIRGRNDAKTAVSAEAGFVEVKGVEDPKAIFMRLVEDTRKVMPVLDLVEVVLSKDDITVQREVRTTVKETW